jgi:hypothetical protein
MDDEHNVVAQKKPDVASYKVALCAALVIHTAGYTMRVPPAQGVAGPNAVHVYQSRSQNKYRATWTGGQPVSLNAATLERLDGDKIFSGFQQGQSFIIAVGQDNMPLPAGSKISFTPMWVATVDVSAGGN